MLAGDKFLPELHLRQPRFSYNACGLFTKHAGFKNGLASMVYIEAFEKKTRSQAITISKGRAITMKNLPKNYTNQ